MRLLMWRYQRFHPSLGAGWWSIGVLVGLYLGQFVFVEYSLFTVFIIGSVSIAFLVRLRWYGCVILAVLGLIVGMLHGSQYYASLQPLTQLSGQAIIMHGTVSEDPSRSKRGDTRLVLGSVHDKDRSYAGSVWVTLRGAHVEIKRGDQLTLAGIAKPGFGPYQTSLSYPSVLTHASTHDPIIALRDRFAQALRSVVIEPAASLGLGFVIGQRSELPPSFDDELRIVGLTHLVVASGYNLMILVRLAKRLFEKHSKFLVAFSSGLLIVSFIAVSGASPSMTRAGIVAGLSLAAWYYGRRFHPILLIIYVAVLTAFLSPIYLWADLGWWLSFLAFFGVLVVGPAITNLISRTKQLPALVQVAVEASAAQIMTLPLIMMTFGNLPLLALVANIISAPLIPYAMLLTFACGLVAMILPLPLVGLPAEIILSYFVAITHWLAAPSWSTQPVTISPSVMTIAYLTILLVVAIIIWRRHINLRTSAVIE